MPGEAELYHRLGFDCGTRILRVIHGDELAELPNGAVDSISARILRRRPAVGGDDNSSLALSDLRKTIHEITRRKTTKPIPLRGLRGSFYMTGKSLQTEHDSDA